MEPTEPPADVFVDHKETVIDVPRTSLVLASRTLNSSSHPGRTSPSSTKGQAAASEVITEFKCGVHESCAEAQLLAVVMIPAEETGEKIAGDSTSSEGIIGEQIADSTSSEAVLGEQIVDSTSSEAVLGEKIADSTSSEAVLGEQISGDITSSEAVLAAGETATQDKAISATTPNAPSESATASEIGSTPVVAEETATAESSAGHTTTTTKHVTTLYTQRISGRSSSSGGSDVKSPVSPGAPDTDGNRPVFGRRGDLMQSPTEVCSVQFSVAAGVASSTTTAFARSFSKTVETEEDATLVSATRERHLSECSITIGQPQNNTDSKITENEAMLESADDSEVVFSECLAPVKTGKDKDASEYCPGLAIRTLTLEHLQEKRLSPEKETAHIQAAESSNMSVSAKVFTTLSDHDESLLLTSPEGTVLDTSGVIVTSSEARTSRAIASHDTSAWSAKASVSGMSSGGKMLMQCREGSSSAAATRKPLFNPIEVERKFSITADTEERLRALGARLHKEKFFMDVYFDNDDYDLILSDCWLRKRNDAWEAKIPLKTQSPNALFAPASQYREVTDEREISAWLVDRLRLDSWMRGDPIDLLVQATGLTAFARFTTTRRSYTLPTCVVDLDQTDHGFKVGEIEVMAASPEEVPHALEIIASVAHDLGVEECDRPLGKMSLYLLQFNPQLFHRLASSVLATPLSPSASTQFPAT